MPAACHILLMDCILCAISYFRTKRYSRGTVSPVTCPAFHSFNKEVVNAVNRVRPSS